MYRLIRNIHLTLGLAFALALAVYLVSSVRLAHRSWFKPQPTVSEKSVAVDPRDAATPRALGLHLIEEHGFRGEIVRIQPSDEGSFAFTIRRLGTAYQVRYQRGAREAHVKETRLAFIGMLQSMHFSYGFWHEMGLINIWGAVLLLTSIALLAIGASGIYLWFETHDERKVGSVLLTSALVFGLGLLVLVRIQG